MSRNCNVVKAVHTAQSKQMRKLWRERGSHHVILENGYMKSRVISSDLVIAVRKLANAKDLPVEPELQPTAIKIQKLKADSLVIYLVRVMRKVDKIYTSVFLSFYRARLDALLDYQNNGATYSLHTHKGLFNHVNEGYLLTIRSNF